MRIFKEIEVKFLEIDGKEIIDRLRELGADDLGEDLLKETIFYDKEKTFKIEHKFVRLRETEKSSALTYKQHFSKGRQISEIDDVDEAEFCVSDAAAARIFLKKIGLEAAREQEKRRHSFKLAAAAIEIDRWPKIPAYLEIEGNNEKIIKETAFKLGLNWRDAFFGSARDVIENIYKIPVTEYRYFTFKKQG